MVLPNALKVMVNNQFKENFYEKRKKRAINVLIVFFIFYKNNIKIFLKLIVNHGSKDTH